MKAFLWIRQQTMPIVYEWNRTVDVVDEPRTIAVLSPRQPFHAHPLGRGARVLLVVRMPSPK